MSCEKACWKDVNNIMVSRVEKHDGGGWEAYDYDWGSRPTGRGKTPLEALADFQTVTEILDTEMRRKEAIRAAAAELKDMSLEDFHHLIEDPPGWIAQWLEKTLEKKEESRER